MIDELPGGHVPRNRVFTTGMRRLSQRYQSYIPADGNVSRLVELPRSRLGEEIQGRDTSDSNIEIRSIRYANIIRLESGASGV